MGAPRAKQVSQTTRWADRTGRRNSFTVPRPTIMPLEERKTSAEGAYGSLFVLRAPALGSRMAYPRQIRIASSGDGLAWPSLRKTRNG